MGLTTDPNHPDLTRGGDKQEVPQSKVYLVLSEEERAKGFVRPVRHSYRHVGKELPKPSEGIIEDLSDEDKERYKEEGWVALFKYNPNINKIGVGKMCTQREVDLIRQGRTRLGACNSVTSMGTALSETYAREPGFYGFTYCINCSKHLPVEEFVWEGTDQTVGS